MIYYLHLHNILYIPTSLQKMFILNRAISRIHSPLWIRYSSHTVTQPQQIHQNKNNYVLSKKGGPAPSDPLYEDLLYSSEVEVYLTAKRGKAFHEIEAAKRYQAENERKMRERSAASKSVPLALQYLYDSSKIQNEEDVTENEEIDVVEEIAGHLAPPVFPYGIYDPIDGHDHDMQMKGDNNNVSEERSVNDESENIEKYRRGRGRRSRKGDREENFQRSEDAAAEEVDFDSIKDSEHSQEIRQLFTEDHLFKFGTADPGMVGASTGVPCGGCGAPLHCTDEKVPGFVPSQILASRRPHELRAVLCQRCYFIKEYKVALKLNVRPEDYPRAIEHIKDKKALVMLVVDLLDFPGSVWPGILELLGKNKKVILVGNKFDLILPDSKSYYRNICNIVRQEFLNKCWSESTEDSCFPQIIGTCCISATTGFNVEKLVEMVFNYWKNQNDALPGDIYIVGCTNVGKSSLFNTLLDSDLCKIQAVNKVENATISPVPGTTLSLLKFPVTRPEPHFLANRRRRLRVADSAFKKLETDRLKRLSENKHGGDPLLAVPSHYTIKHTLLDKVKVGGDGEQDDKLYSNSLDLERVPGLGVPDRLDPDERRWGRHCHDTPGTVSEDQIINLLTAEEVGHVLATAPLRPRTLLLRRGHSLLLGGLARLDMLETNDDIHPVRVTVFCSSELPINMVATEAVPAFLELAIDRNFVKVPSGHRAELPELRGVEFMARGARGSGMDRVDSGNWRGAADIVLSSCGWVMLAPKADQECEVRAWTVGGRGLGIREPFLPNAVNYRGKRIAGTPAFRNDRLYEPLNPF